ncbi:hypothetical protein YC2023_017313 [Brassica napus]
MVCTSKPLGLLLGDLCGRIAPPTLSNHREALYRFKRLHTDRGGEFASAVFNLGCNDRGGEVVSDMFNLGCTDRGGEFALGEFNLLCEENKVEAVAAEVDSIPRNKTCELVDRSAGVKHTWVCDTKIEECNTTHVGLYGCNTTHVPMESTLKILKAEDEPEIKAPGVEQKADILTRARVRKMADVTRVIVAVSFSHKTHPNLSEEVRRRFYKNWTNSKKRRYGSEESIRSNLEKDVNPMGGFAHHGVVKEDYLMIMFKQMRSLIGVQEIDLPNSNIRGGDDDCDVTPSFGIISVFEMVPKLKNTQYQTSRTHELKAQHQRTQLYHTASRNTQEHKSKNTRKQARERKKWNEVSQYQSQPGSDTI